MILADTRGMAITKRKNYDPQDRIAPGVYRIDFNRFALRVVVKWKGQRVVDETKEIQTSDRVAAIEERERWAAELRAPYTPTEVLDTEGRVIFRDAPALPPGSRFVIGIDLAALKDQTAIHVAPAPKVAPLGLRMLSTHDDCDCSSCLPWTY